MTGGGTPRLFLVAPASESLDFARQLAEALSGGDVAAVLFPPFGEEALSPLVAATQQHGAAALVLDDTRLAGHVRGDGVQVDGGLQEARLAIDSFRPKRIVGVGNLASRHAAMEAGELDVDYLFFGRPHGDTHDAPHPKALDLAEWWSEVMQVPAVIMAGSRLSSVADAAATGAEFVAAGAAIWGGPAGPREAVREALSLMQSAGREAA